MSDTNTLVEKVADAMLDAWGNATPGETIRNTLANVATAIVRDATLREVEAKLNDLIVTADNDIEEAYDSGVIASLEAVRALIALGEPTPQPTEKVKG